MRRIRHIALNMNNGDQYNVHSDSKNIVAWHREEEYTRKLEEVSDVLSFILKNKTKYEWLSWDDEAWWRDRVKERESWEPEEEPKVVNHDGTFLVYLENVESFIVVYENEGG